MNISNSTTRLNKPELPSGAGSLEQGHESTKSSENKTTTTGQWAGKVVERMAIREARVKVKS